MTESPFHIEELFAARGISDTYKKCTRLSGVMYPFVLLCSKEVYWNSKHLNGWRLIRKYSMSAPSRGVFQISILFMFISARFLFSVATEVFSVAIILYQYLRFAVVGLTMIARAQLRYSTAWDIRHQLKQAPSRKMRVLLRSLLSPSLELFSAWTWVERRTTWLLFFHRQFFVISEELIWLRKLFHFMGYKAKK